MGISSSSNAFPTLTLAGSAGFNYLIQGSTNLADWEPVAIVINTNGVVHFTDTSATNFTRRFYRAVEP